MTGELVGQEAVAAYTVGLKLKLRFFEAVFPPRPAGRRSCHIQTGGGGSGW